MNVKYVDSLNDWEERPSQQIIVNDILYKFPLTIGKEKKCLTSKGSVYKYTYNFQGFERSINTAFGDTRVKFFYKVDCTHWSGSTYGADTQEGDLEWFKGITTKQGE